MGMKPLQVAIDQSEPGTSNGVQVTGPGTSFTNPLYVVDTVNTIGDLKNSGQVESAGIQANGSGSETDILPAPAVSFGTVGWLQHAIVGSSTTMKFEFQTVDKYGNATTVFTIFTGGGAPLFYEYKAQNAGECPTDKADGFYVRFQVKVTNMDQNQVASAYATFWWAETTQ